MFPANPRLKWITMACAIALIVLPPVAHSLGEPYLITLFTRIVIYGIAVASLDLILGYAGLVSFGHAAFLGVGAYAMAILSHHGSEGTALFYWGWSVGGTNEALVAWPIAILASALAATLIGALCLRTTGIHFIMITLAFAQMLFFFFVSLETYGGDDGLSLYARNTLAGMELSDDTLFYYLCLAGLIVFLVLCLRLVNAPFGMVVRGIRLNEARMQALGYDTYRYKLTCFAIGGAGAGLAGLLLANHIEFVSPSQLHWTLSGELLVMAILGGTGTLLGAVAGAGAFLLMEEILSTYTEHWMVFLGPFLLLVVLYSRGGIYALVAGSEARRG